MYVQGLDLGEQAWWKVLLLAEPSQQHKKYHLKDLIEGESLGAGAGGFNGKRVLSMHKTHGLHPQQSQTVFPMEES